MSPTRVDPARKRLSAAARREQILDLTHAIVDAEGFHAATPNRIADDAGVTRPVIYQQFGDVAGVFVALIDRERARSATQLAEAVAAQPVTDDGPLVRTFMGALAAVDAHPATWRLFLIPPEGAPPELHERLAEARETLHRFIADELVKAFPRMPDPDYTARMVQASGRELLLLRLTDPVNATNDRLVALVRTVGAAIGGWAGA